MTSDRNPPPTRDPQGLARGLVWSDLAAQMRAEAAAAGDDRFEKLDALVTRRRRTPYEATPIDLDRVRAERATRESDEPAERAA